MNQKIKRALFNLERSDGPQPTWSYIIGTLSVDSLRFSKSMEIIKNLTFRAHFKNLMNKGSIVAAMSLDARPN